MKYGGLFQTDPLPNLDRISPELAYDECVKKSCTLYIKNPIAHRLARQLAKQMGVTLTDAVIHALENQIRAVKRPIDRKKIDAIRAKMAALPVLDPRTPDEILGYDEFGLPH
jgi:antitoxin VapB